MGSMSIWHWMIVLVVVVLIFGTKKLRNVGQDLGGAVKGFKEGMKGDGEPPSTTSSSASTSASSPPPPSQQLGGQTIEGEVKKENAS